MIFIIVIKGVYINIKPESGDSRSGSLDAGVVVYPTLGMSNPWRYRNKAQVPFGEERGELIGGFYAQKPPDY